MPIPVEANGMGSRASPHGEGLSIYDNHMVEFTYADGTKFFSQCRSVATWAAGTASRAQSVVGVTKGKMEPGRQRQRRPYRQEHVDLINAIRTGGKLHDGWHAATSSMSGVLGRMATYSGQVVRWDDAVAKGPSEGLQRFALDADPHCPARQIRPNYAVPIPGIYKPY